MTFHEIEDYTVYGTHDVFSVCLYEIAIYVPQEHYLIIFPYILIYPVCSRMIHQNITTTTQRNMDGMINDIHRYEYKNIIFEPL